MNDNLPLKLLAKGRKADKEDITLKSHLEDVSKAARQIFRLDLRWGRNWCRFFKINNVDEREKFLLHLEIAALFHDIGKANAEFQSLVQSKSNEKQTLRHEHLSALILHLPEVREWLGENYNLDLEVITAAVLSHHLKAANGGEWEWGQPKGKKVLDLYDSHEDINYIFRQVGEVAGLIRELILSRRQWRIDEKFWLETRENGFDAARNFQRNVRRDENRLRLLLAVKAGLMVADAAASGLVREGHSIEDWITEKTCLPAIAEGEVAAAIIDKRAEKIFGKGAPEAWSDFQLQAATLGKRALLLAACGSGKTIAAWKWAEAQSLEHEIGKIIFLYPTRGTATEGFKDYVGNAPEMEAGLLHGTAKYELDSIADNPNDVTINKNYETEARLFALGFWGKRYFSATVDQFLSFLEHSYSSICLLPVLADSAVIIDEVHSFDRRMFETLVCFLKQFDVPVLCMTATLPKSRRENLEKEIEGLRVYPSKAEQAELRDLEEKENHERYNLEFVANKAAALDIAAACYKAGKRVLWVVNTVKRCQDAAKKLENDFRINPLVYHSRFRLKDRQDRHTETVAAFKQRTAPKIAVTTQVCEMSLDLDADVLITEFAPTSSLVQRFGRANRNLDGKESGFRARLIVYRPENLKPYGKEEIDAGEIFLKDLPLNNISQRLLAEKLEQHAQKERQTDGDFAAFIKSGYYAVPGNFRDIDAFTNPCVLSGDFAEIKKCLAAKKTIDGFVISVPKQFVQKDAEKPSSFPKYLGVADSQFYKEDFGFMTELENDDE